MESRTKGQMITTRCLIFFSLLTQLYASHSPPSFNSGTEDNEVKVGVVLDMASWRGKTIHSCISMAISDFYASKPHYRRRIVLHPRDSEGDPTQAVSAALDLLENVKVKAIIGPETYEETKFLALLGNKAKVPIFSLSSIPSSSGKYPFFVQIKQDETTQFKGIAAILKSYKWRMVSFIYEDSDDGREIMPHLVEYFHEANIHIACKIAISPFSTDDQILNELHKLITIQPTINIVHMSPSLASRLFVSSKRLGMMKDGYAWIVTDKTINHLHTMDSEVIESLQGALGFKAYIPASSKLRDITLRWRRKFSANNPFTELRELDVLGIWAYDTIWALAESVERARTELLNAVDQSRGLSGTSLLNDIARIGFTGLSGEFKILNGKLHSESYAVINVLGQGERKVGFWTPKDGLVKEIQPVVTGSHPSTRRGLEAVIWPGGSAIAPKGRLMLTSGRKLRIAVPKLCRYKELVDVYLDPRSNITSVTGFCIDVFEAAIKSLDYEVPYEFIPCEKFESYNELVSEVYHQNYDGIVGDITITANRSLYVDFTSPFTDLGVGTITRRESKGMWVFLKPLRANLWLTSACFFVLMGLVVWAIEHPTNEEFQGSVAHQIGTVLWFGFSTLVYAHREKLTSNLSRFVVIIWLFVVYILTSSYTATLSSMLTIKQIELASAGRYIGTQNGEVTSGVIKSNVKFSADHGFRQYNSPEELADALSRGSKKGGVEAIVDEIPYVKIFLGKYGADYAMVASDSTTNGFAFAFQKGSPLISDLSLAIVALREEGKLAMLEKAWFKRKSSFMPEDASATPNVLNLHSFGGLFLISLVSCVLALLLHCIFKLSKKSQVNNIIHRFLDGGKLTFLLGYLAPRNDKIIELVNGK